MTRRTARSPSSALGTATTGQVLAGGPVGEGGRRYGISSAALRLVPHDDLPAEGDGAYRNLLNQPATTEGAKR
jgi:peptide methionine sulfoxide reductase MsrB